MFQIFYVSFYGYSLCILLWLNPVIREEYLRPRISVKKVIFLFDIACLVKSGSIALPTHPNSSKQCCFFCYIRLHGCISSARTCCVPGSTAASGSARTRSSWLHGCKWQCKDQLLYLAL